MIDVNTTYVKKFTFELLEMIQKETKKAEKLKLLKTMDNEWALKDILKGTYDDKIQWILPKGEPPYTPSRPESVPSNLRKKHKEFGYFAKGGPGMKLPAFKIEARFLGILESIHPEDAKLVIAMINKKPIKGITKKLVEEAFPGLI